MPYMKKGIWLTILALVVTLVIAFLLRYQNFPSVPLPGQSTDEYSNTWVGLSLIRLGMPVGISGLVGIKNYPTYINPDRILSSTVPGGALAISYPGFHPPPMMGIASGAFAYLSGERNFGDVALLTIRKPVVVLGTVTVGLLFWLAALWFGPVTALIISLLYATSPLIVIGSRMVQAENGLVPVWLFSLILLTLTQKKDGPNLIRWAAFFAGLTVLFKLSGIVAIISGVFIIGRKRRSLIEFLMISLSVAFLFVIYGLAIDTREFMAVFLSNTSRVYGIGLDAIYDLFTSTKITSTKYLTDGWPLVGWLGMIYLAAKKDKSSLFVLICLASYLAIYILFGSASYGWYRIPFMPFLFIAAGYFISEGVTNSNYLVSAIALLIPLGVNLSRLFEITKVPLLILIMRFGILGLMILLLTGLVWPENRIFRNFSRSAVILLLVAAVLTNILYLQKINVDYWYKVN